MYRFLKAHSGVNPLETPEEFLKIEKEFDDLRKTTTVASPKGVHDRGSPFQAAPVQPAPGQPAQALHAMACDACQGNGWFFMTGALDQKFPCTCVNGLFLKDRLIARRALGDRRLHYGKHNGKSIRSAATEDPAWANIISTMQETGNTREARLYIETMQYFHSYFAILDDSMRNAPNAG